MSRYFALMLCAIFFSSCAYQFQGRYNPLKAVGVEKIYVTQFRNSTYRPGIEHLFTTAMIKEIQKSRSFQLVSSEEEADAVLLGEVIQADSGISSTRAVVIGDGKSVDVASEFSANVSAGVQLVDKTKRVLFSQSISSSKIYPGSVAIEDAGATVPLVNDSEQRLAIQFLASQMMASLYQRMIDAF